MPVVYDISVPTPARFYVRNYLLQQLFKNYLNVFACRGSGHNRSTWALEKSLELDLQQIYIEIDSLHEFSIALYTISSPLKYLYASNSCFFKYYQVVSFPQQSLIWIWSVIASWKPQDFHRKLGVILLFLVGIFALYKGNIGGLTLGVEYPGICVLVHIRT
jgi:hypothetical protein